jgi:hypothetical protein
LASNTSALRFLTSTGAGTAKAAAAAVVLGVGTVLVSCKVGKDEGATVGAGAGGRAGLDRVTRRVTGASATAGVSDLAFAARLAFGLAATGVVVDVTAAAAVGGVSVGEVVAAFLLFGVAFFLAAASLPLAAVVVSAFLVPFFGGITQWMDVFWMDLLKQQSKKSFQMISSIKHDKRQLSNTV